MDEFKFVLRCLLVTCLILIVSQYKWNNETLEAKAEYLLVDSEAAARLREVAAGGVLFIKKSGQSTYEFIQQKFFRDKAHEARRDQNESISE